MEKKREERMINIRWAAEKSILVKSDTVAVSPFFSDNKKIRLIYTGSLYLDLRDPSPLFSALQMIRDDPSTQNLLESLEVLFFGPNVDILQTIIEKNTL